MSQLKTAYLAQRGGAGSPLGTWLREAGFAVQGFDCGLDLMDAVQLQQPHVVIADVDLPRGDGFQLARALKQDPLTEAIPVILLVGTGDDVAADCFEAGADDFVRKPVQARELCGRARAAARHFDSFQRRHEQHAELADMYFRLAETEEQARLSEARVHAIIEAAQDAVFTLTADGYIDLMNGSAERMFGFSRSEAITNRFMDLFGGDASRAELAAAIERVATNSVPCERREAVARTRAGDEFPADCSLTRAERPEGAVVCAFVRDLRAARRVEGLLRQAQQLEAVGRIAAGIAHEINTPIQCIGDSLYFLEQAFADLRPAWNAYQELVKAAAADATVGEFITRARDAEEEADLEYVLGAAPAAVGRAIEMSKRIADIVKATKDFARPEQRGAIIEDMAVLVGNVINISRGAVTSVAELDVEIESVSVRCHASELSEAIRHLVSNATDAVIAAGRRGHISVRVRRLPDAALVTVSDDGCGIPAEVRPRVFDPFFTTKEVGRGVGLGLFVASSAAQRHEGSLTFESTPGRGSVFQLRIPLDFALARAR